MRKLRNAIVLATFILTTLDLLQHVVSLSAGWLKAIRLIFLPLGASVAIMGGTLIAYALLCLWDGSSFVKGLIDHEPDTRSRKLC